MNAVTNSLTPAEAQTAPRHASLEDLVAHETAKDLRLNLRVIRENPLLTPAQAWGAALASAIAARSPAVIRAVAAEAAPHLSPEALRAARVAGTIMGMNNIYYRFQHLVETPEYGQIPAGLRMHSLAEPGVPRIDFELWALAASAVNGCGWCVQAHERKLRQAGVGPETVHAAVRIASVMHGVATAASAAEAFDESV